MTRLLLVAALLVPLPAGAEPPRDLGHTVALSISPIHLLLTTVELQAEFMASEIFSAALILGAGSVAVTIDGEEERFSVLEAGGQVRGYFYGTSEGGGYAGVEVLYITIDGETEGVTALGNGIAAGGMAGYKWAWESFFLDLNGGLAYLVVNAEATDGSETADSSESDVLPILNFNLGWAF